MTVKLALEMFEAHPKGINANLEGKDIQIYTARGVDLHDKIQILEPQEFALQGSFHDSDEKKDVELNFAVLTNVALDISMQDISLLS
eukprot:3865789-Ditylum_brightwellii.AAC.1